MALTATVANNILGYLHGGGAPTAITAPIKLALATSAPTDSAAGTEVTGGSYARQNLTWAAASGKSQATSAVASFTGMPVATVTHVDLYDSTGTPVRTEFGVLTSSKTTASGDTLSFAAGAITSALA